MSDDFSTGQPHRPVESVVHDIRVLGEVLGLRATRTPEAAAHFEKEDGRWRRASWRQLEAEARRVARGLVDLGVEVGERVAILGPTHAAWARQDLGAHMVGAVTLGIYPLQSPEQVRYILEHSECRVVFVADEVELETVLEAARGVSSLEAIVPWTSELARRFGDRDPRIVPIDRFSGDELDDASIAGRLERVSPEDTAILIYTSGTTGPPKGAMISHANLIALLRYQGGVFGFYQDDLVLSFLPMAHATERNLGFYVRVANGVAAAYASSVGAVLQELGEARPTIFGSVPRLFEKAYDRVCSEIAKKPAAVQAIFRWAVAVGKQRTRYVTGGRAVPAGLALRYKLAHALVFRKVHAAFGGRIRALITGAAPISLEILEFFWAAGLPIYEGYGMTEATVITHITREGATRLGTVGRPIPPMEHRLADDGEVLIRGPLIFQGYYKDEEATREVLDEDGWLRTGDVGEIDADGYLRITDRKKHLIITAGGKNVAPANIERAIKNQSPLISQVHAHGDRRPYVVALIAPSPLETLEWGAEAGVLAAEEKAGLERELLANPSARSPALNEAMARVVAERRFQELFLEPVARGNRELARVERVRRFTVLDRDFSQEGGELTPTMKPRRKFIEEAYAEVFERIYGEDGFGLDARDQGPG